VPASSDSLTAGFVELVINAGPIAKLVLAILLGFSIVSWALILEKWLHFRRIRRQTIAFLKVFREGRRPSVVHTATKKYRDSPLAQMYGAAYQEFSAITEVVDRVLDDDDFGPQRLESVSRAMRRTAAMETSKLERYLPFLATTASATPFIGLFGTVWGVMAAFHGIGKQGSASLGVVAPGISEALIATAAGLAAAIPAVVGYNYFVGKVRHWATEMDNFALELANLVERRLLRTVKSLKDGY
jgi:biopolymer transport protein TolQ